MNTTTKKAANSIVGKLTAGILAGAAVALAGPAAAAAFQGAGDAVLVVGDSLEVGSGPYLGTALPGVEIELDAERGRSSAQGVRVVQRRLDARHGVVVFPLGTNDSLSNPGALAASLTAVQRLSGGRCLVVATVARPPQRGVSVAGLNRVVETFAAQTGAQVIDWRSAVESEPELLGRDRVHATSRGYALRAGLLGEAVQGCLLGGGASGIPAPRNPNARPPRDSRRAERRAVAPGTPLALPEPTGPLVALLTRAMLPVAGALHAARAVATKPGPEPVLGG